ncbi:beta-lactamase family protein [Saccharopolyspora hirsuta]|uniref:Beta-lactamase family protein n=1 Tax=Saccharopolyspora hirsuta TaxID=1837 RepID=A0A5M7BTP4_SACHI|nr:beta-lactamase family protein [Saccharopolyspora hirsuta]
MPAARARSTGRSLAFGLTTRRLSDTAALQGCRQLHPEPGSARHRQRADEEDTVRRAGRRDTADRRLTGLLAERVTGRPASAQVADRVIRPLGLRDTCWPGVGDRTRAVRRQSTSYIGLGSFTARSAWPPSRSEFWSPMLRTIR